MHCLKAAMVIEEASVDVFNTNRFQCFEQLGQTVCGQGGIAAADQYKITVSSTPSVSVPVIASSVRKR